MNGLVPREDVPQTEGLVYADAAGAALYTQSQLSAAHSQLSAQVFPNPHSQPTDASSIAISTARSRILDEWFSTDQEHYALIFTSSATAALKLLAECYSSSTLAYLTDNHTSVLGLRPAHSTSLPLESHAAVHDWLNDRSQGEDSGLSAPVLLALPAKSNFDGQILPDALLKHAVATPSTPVLLDAAAAVATDVVDLSDPAAAPDFVVFSAYKVVGYPTGLGGLLVKRSSISLLSKQYYGGGTVAATIANSPEGDWVRKRSLFEAAFEDGTLPFLSIASLLPGLDRLAQVGGLPAVAEYTVALGTQTYDALSQLVHGNGAPVVTLYSARGSSIVTLNVRDPQGGYVGYSEVDRLASLATPRIFLRTGCLCNPGKCHAALGLSPDEVKAHYAAGHVCWDGNDVMDGKPTGVVRLSFGWTSQVEDVAAIVSFFASTFVQSDSGPAPASQPRVVGEGSGVVDEILVYPIKSGGPLSPPPPSWTIGPRGFEYDREWMVLGMRPDGTYEALNQKKEPRLCLISPSLDLSGGTLTLTWAAPSPSSSTRSAPISISFSFDHDGSQVEVEPEVEPSGGPACAVPGSKVRAEDFGVPEPDAVGAWLSQWLERPAVLVRTHKDRVGIDGVSGIGFANESQYLMVNAASVDALNDAVNRVPRFPPSRFRPNVVLSGLEPYAEDAWEAGTVLRLGEAEFTSSGGCTRCRMVCIDQETGESSAEPLMTLHKTRKREGRIQFGVHLSTSSVGACIAVGDSIHASHGVPSHVPSHAEDEG